MTQFNPCIIGGGHVPFGAHFSKHAGGERQDSYSLESMLSDVIREALDDAGVEADGIEGIWLGSCSPGSFANQELLAPLVADLEPGLRFKRVSQCTAACASGSVALHAAADALQARQVDMALVIGIEKMTLLDTAGVTRTLSHCSYWPQEGSQGVSFPELFARLANQYQQYYSIDASRFERMLASVAATNYRHGIHNPLAHFGPDSLIAKNNLTTTEQILVLKESSARANPLIAPPLRLHDCAPISDGAAALLMVREDHPLAQQRSVEIAGRSAVSDFLSLKRRKQAHKLEGARHAMTQAYNQAGIRAEQLNIIELHDCFTSNQLLCLEAAGICLPGQAGEDYLAGRFEEDKPVGINLSGGLKSKGHPVGATGVSMHYFAYRQLIQEAVGFAYPGQAETAAVLNIGGSGVVSCATILRKQGG